MPLLEYLTRVVTLEKNTFRRRFAKYCEVCFHMHCSKTVHFHLGNNIMLLYISNILLLYEFEIIDVREL